MFDFSTAYKCRCTRKGPKIRYKDVQKLEIKPKHPYCQEKMILWVITLFSLSVSFFLFSTITPFLTSLLLLLPLSSISFSSFVLFFFLHPLTFIYLSISPLAFLLLPLLLHLFSHSFSPTCTLHNKSSYQQYLYLLDTQIYKCNCTVTVLQSTIKIFGSLAVQALSKHLVICAWRLRRIYSVRMNLWYNYTLHSGARNGLLLEMWWEKKHSFPELSRTFKYFSLIKQIVTLTLQIVRKWSVTIVLLQN